MLNFGEKLESDDNLDRGDEPLPLPAAAGLSVVDELDCDEIEKFGELVRCARPGERRQAAAGGAEVGWEVRGVAEVA